MYFLIAVLQSSFHHSTVLLFRGRLDFPIVVLATFIISDDNLLISSSIQVWFMYGVCSLGGSNWFSVMYWSTRQEERSQFDDLSFHLFIGSVLGGW